MTYILSDDRDAEDSFERYRAYLARERERFPPGALELATSDWYFSFNDHRGPHDAWLQSMELGESTPATPRGERRVTLRVRLLNAWNDGHIELFYPRVFGYRLDLFPEAGGHQDWRYDEFTINGAGHLIHRIEWWGSDEAAEWRIEASDVELTYHPIST
jgi:hypothetical protein